MKKILFVLGSLRHNSFNAELSRIAAEAISSRAEVEYLDYRALPFMNQDLEHPAPGIVTRIRESVGGADALWIFTPEYNHSYPGHLKNLIDWLSRQHDGLERNELEIWGKPVYVTGTGGANATRLCREKLTELLTFVGAEAKEEHQLGLILNAEAWSEDRMILTDEQRQQLMQQVEIVLQSLGA